MGCGIMSLVLKEILVKDVMDKNFLIAYEDSPISEIKEELIRDYKKEVFIYDKADKVQGIITMKDICNFVREKESNINQKCAIDIATKGVISVSEDSDLLICRNIMLKNNVGRLAVLKEGKIVGVIRQEHIRDFYYMKVEETSEILKTAINYIHEAVCVINNKGIVIVWNENAEKLYNLPKEKIIGRPLDEFFPNAINMKVLKTRKVIENCYHEPRDGTHIVISAAPIILNNEFMGL